MRSTGPSEAKRFHAKSKEQVARRGSPDEKVRHQARNRNGEKKRLISESWLRLSAQLRAGDKWSSAGFRPERGHRD